MSMDTKYPYNDPRAHDVDLTELIHSAASQQGKYNKDAEIAIEFSALAKASKKLEKHAKKLRKKFKKLEKKINK